MWERLISKFGQNLDKTGKSYVGKLRNFNIYAEYDDEYDFMDVEVRTDCGFLHMRSTSIHDVQDKYDHICNTIFEMYEGVKRDYLL